MRYLILLIICLCTFYVFAGLGPTEVLIDTVSQSDSPLDIDIAAQTVDPLNVDVTAFTYGTLDVDLVAQSVGDIGVDIKAQTLSPLIVSTTGTTDVSITDNFLIEVAKGSSVGYSVIHKYGRNANMTNGTEVAITSDGAIPFLSSATTVRIKAGGNAADTADGAGAREVTVQGSDENGEFISEAIATNGASASSATTATFFRVYRAYVSSQGTYLTDGLATNGANQADIVIEDSGGTTDLITISQYEGQTQYAAYHIPSDKTGYLADLTATVSSNKEADVIMWARGNATSDTTVPVPAKRLKLYLDGVVGESQFHPTAPQLIGSDCDVWFTGIATAAGTECSVDFEILLVDN